MCVNSTDYVSAIEGKGGWGKHWSAKPHPLLTMRKVKFYYDVVQSAILAEAASFLETRVYSTNNCLTSLSPVFAKS